MTRSIIEWASFTLLLVLYGVVALGHAYLAPLTTGPDELAHYEYVNFIAEHGRLPFNIEEREQASYKSDQPPLYHLLAALPAALVDTAGPPELKRYGDHPRRQLIERTRHAWGLYNTLDEQWPYRGEVLRWHIGRWLAIFFGLLTVAVTYFMAHDLFGGRWLLALAAAAIVAFIPRFILTGSMLNYETLLAFVAALFLWALLKFANPRMGESANEVQRSSQLAETASQSTAQNSELKTQNSKLPFAVGLLAGLAIVTKLSALILPLEIVIAFWLISRAVGQRWRTWLAWLGAAAVGVLLPVGLWYGFVVARFNTVAEDGLWTGLLRPLIAADASDATTNRLLSFLTGGEAGFTAAIENLDSGPPWEWVLIFFRTFWTVGIEGQQPLGWSGLIMVLTFCIIAGTGLIVLWREAGSRGAASIEQEAREQGAEEQESRNPQSAIRNPQPATQNSKLKTQNFLHASRITLHAPRLIIALLLLHLLLPLVLPLLRYAVTFSLADTAQGRHLLFMAAPALALLLVMGLAKSAEFSLQNSRLVSRVQSPESRVQKPAKRNSELKTQNSKLIPTLSAFVPGLFLFFWSLAQLQTMSWAYLPLLPVSTLPVDQNLVDYQVNQPLNDYVTLLGFNKTFDGRQRQLEIELYWQSIAVSPVDLLTEVTLVDTDGNVQAEWLGYPAGGRYPTRAWDPGDIVRDPLWLPTGGLPAGQYTILLNVQPTARQSPITPLTSPLALAPVDIPADTLQVFEQGFAFTGMAAGAAGYTVWQAGQPVQQPVTFNYRETIPVTLPPPAAGQSRTLQMVTPGAGGEPLAFDPVRQTDTQALFIVGPDWPTGEYYLRAEVSAADQDRQVSNSGVVAQVIDRWERQFDEPSMQQRLEANFANQVELLGYDLGANRAEPGGGLPVTLYWRGLDWLGSDYTIFTKLLKADDQTVHGGRDRLPQEGYRTLYWAPGEVVSDPFGLPVDPDAPDGIYYLNVGLYQTVDGRAVSLRLVQDNELTGITSLNIGPIKIGRTPPDFTLETASPDKPINVPLGEQIELLGFDLEAGEFANLRMGESADERMDEPANQPITNSPNATNVTNSINSINLKLYWHALRQPDADYTTFVHLRDAAGNIVAQKDQPPLAGAYPTSLWDPGETIADTLILPLPPDLPAGTYQLVTGLYDFASGSRLAIPDTPDNTVTLASLEFAP